MNILIIGTGEVEKALVELCLKSKNLSHLYTASNEPINNIPNIEYLSLEDLVYKAKSIQADATLFVDKNLMKEGIIDLFRKNMLNIFSVNEKWLNLETSRLVAKQLMNHYAINTPKVLKIPTVFPVVLRAVSSNDVYVANSMQELVQKKEELTEKDVFIEEYLDGEIYEMISLWDGKNLLSFPMKNLTEVQLDRLDIYNTKLNFMLSDENADFMGFFISRLLWAKNDWYVLEYKMGFDENTDFSAINKDFISILNSAIYQKLNEII